MEELAFCLAYIDHKELVKLMADAWEVVCKDKEIERKRAYKKVL